MVELGQIRLVELNGASSLPAADRAALDGADVVLYDRALAERIAGFLPSGAYAEPLSAGFAPAASRISLRAVKLASEGWRVVQCVRAGAHNGAPQAAAEPVPAPVGVRRPPQSLAFTANGLAG
jgi:hypothetical protein